MGWGVDESDGQHTSAYCRWWEDMIICKQPKIKSFSWRCRDHTARIWLQDGQDREGDGRNQNHMLPVVFFPTIAREAVTQTRWLFANVFFFFLVLIQLIPGMKGCISPDVRVCHVPRLPIPFHSWEGAQWDFGNTDPGDYGTYKDTTFFLYYGSILGYLLLAITLVSIVISLVIVGVHIWKWAFPWGGCGTRLGGCYL